MKSLTTAFLLLSLAVAASAQDEAARRPAPRKDGPWFGVTLPPRASSEAAVKVGARPPRPIAAEAASPEFNGAAIKSDVQTICRLRHRRAELEGDRQRPDVGPHLRFSFESEDR
jgi:hypothetical protein